MSSTVTTVRPTVKTFPIKQLASRCVDPLLLISTRSFFSNFDRIFFIFLSITKTLIDPIRFKLSWKWFTPTIYDYEPTEWQFNWIHFCFMVKSISINEYTTTSTRLRLNWMMFQLLFSVSAMKCCYSLFCAKSIHLLIIFIYQSHL